MTGLNFSPSTLPTRYFVPIRVRRAVLSIRAGPVIHATSALFRNRETFIDRKNRSYFGAATFIVFDTPSAPMNTARMRATPWPVL